jgi:hypothetical protein
MEHGVSRNGRRCASPQQEQPCQVESEHGGTSPGPLVAPGLSTTRCVSWLPTRVAAHNLQHRSPRASCSPPDSLLRRNCAQCCHACHPVVSPLHMLRSPALRSVAGLPGLFGNEVYLCSDCHASDDQVSAHPAERTLTGFVACAHVTAQHHAGRPNLAAL